MLQSSLKSRTLLGLATAMACGALITSPIRAEAQWYQRLSPAARQTLGAMLAGVPPYGQQLILNAIRALGPARAEMQLAQVRATPPAVGAVVRQQTAQILSVLPAQSHQAFINGLFQVSPQDVQFENYVASKILQQNTEDVDGAALVRRYDDWMRGQTSRAFQQRQDLNLQQSQGTALSPFTEYHDPITGQRMEGYTVRQGWHAYRCPGYNAPVYSTSQPFGCSELQS